MNRITNHDDYRLARGALVGHRFWISPTAGSAESTLGVAKDMSTIKGMVQFGSLTYRIVKVRRATYDAIRILDEVCIGRFETVPRLLLRATETDDTVLRAVATIAIRQARTSWLRLEAVIPQVAACLIVGDPKVSPA